MLVHSYARFSDPGQEAGDSLRRQQDAAVDFCRRKGWTLSDLRFADLGKSGFKGNKQRALEEFEKAVSDGRVKPGDVLLVENVDRLSRKGIRQTQNLVNRLLDEGINIAILTPVEKVYRSGDGNDIGGAIELAAYAFQAHVYSQNLSNRIKAFNENRRAQVRNGTGKLVSSVFPSWLEKLPNGKFKVRPEAVKAIRYIFKRTIEGVGRKRLLTEMNEKFPPISKRKNSHSWNETQLANIVTSRAVLGDLESTVTGELFKGYYPLIIDEKTWLLANRESSKRKSERGPSSQRVNLFNGILYHAVDDCAMGFYSYSKILKTTGVRKHFRRYQSYKNSNRVPGSSPETLDVDQFENMIFRFLPQLQLTGKKRDRQAELMAQRGYVKKEIEVLQKQITTHELSAFVLAGPLSELASQLRKIERDIRCKPAHAVAPSKNYRAELAKMVRGTLEQRRLVRDRLREIVHRIDVLPFKLGPKRRDSVRALVEIEFQNGEVVRGVELDGGDLVQVKLKAGGRLREQCREGFRFGLVEYEQVKKATRN